MRKILLVVLLAVASSGLLAPTVASAAPCAGFSDVDDGNAYCVNVAWLRNRGITLGCDVGGTLYCPDQAVTRLQMAIFMNRLANALLPSNCATGQVMRWTGSQWQCAYDNAPVVIYYGPRFTRFLSSTMPTTLIDAGHLFAASADGTIGMPLDRPASVGGTELRLASVEWCLQANASNGGYVTAAVVYHDEPGASGTPLAAAVSDPTDRSTAGCYVLDVPAVNPRGYSLALGLSGQTTNLTSAAVLLSSVKGTWIPVASP